VAQTKPAPVHLESTLASHHPMVQVQETHMPHRQILMTRDPANHETLCTQAFGGHRLYGRWQYTKNHIFQSQPSLSGVCSGRYP